MEFLLKNCVIADGKDTRKADIRIDGGNIVEIGEALESEIVIDIKGQYVMPGAVDVHVHFRDPGYTNKETIFSGANAAIKGGVTTVLAMANTNPVMDSPDKIRTFMERVKDLPMSVYTVVAATKGLAGEEISSLAEAKEAGAMAISDDGKPIVDTSLFIEVMKTAKEVGLPVLCHCEDPYLFKGGALHHCDEITRLGIKGIRRESEELMLARDGLIALNNDLPVHICHVSTKGSVDLIRFLKAKGAPITAEVAPHHLIFTVEDIGEDLALMKVNPPIREREDVEALLEALRDGTIDMLATDHAPHDIESKSKEIHDASFGISSIEYFVSLVIDKLYHKEGFSLGRINELMTNGAKLLKLRDRGKLEAGYRADLVVVDLDREWEIRGEDLISLGKNCPYLGMKGKGKVIRTIFEGRTVYEEE